VPELLNRTPEIRVRAGATYRSGYYGDSAP